ncbi:hypothetical protein [Pseudoroseomonas ludipueritiae]|uniref:Uncharacterized protein n=1 Tax=Pseudoroseomonas ludipueritiae TaxID=198093 RepID=A0ABR7R4V0_9PROT|nr:hypothetical protein [Pseudoroseomonas ludipueritiae]MBC9176753.1 hypothetical protein [Pseudoroseomonas ludipueritiae]
MSAPVSLTNSEIISLFNILARAVQSRTFPRTATELNDMLKFQGKLLKAGGKLLTASGGIVIPPVDPPVTLPAAVITPAAGSFRTDLASGTAMATVSAVPAGATRTLTVAGGVAEFNADKTQIRRSSTGTLSVGSLSVTVTDTHPNATNSPRSATASLSIVAPPVTLPAISLTAAGASFQTDVAAGTLLATVSQGVPAGATRAFTAGGNVVVFANNQTEIRRGTAGTLTAGSLSVAIADTHPNATNSPRTASATLTITAPVVVDPPVDPGPTDPPPQGEAVKLASFPITGTGAPAGTVYTFGQAFQNGHIGAGDTVSLRLADGTRMATQLDRLSDQYDGSSLLMGGVHVALPAIGSGSQLPVELWKEPAPSSPSTPLNIASRMAGRTCRVEISNGSQTHTLDCVSTPVPADRWFNGPICAQTQFVSEVPASVINSKGRLEVDLAVYSDGSIQADVTLWNFYVFQAGVGDAAYTMRLIGDQNTTMFTLTVPRAPLYTGWGERARWKADGTKVAVSPARHRPPTAYLMRTGLVARYDTDLDFSSRLSEFSTNLNNANWLKPYGTRDIVVGMGGTGGNNVIGHATEAQALWLATGDARVAEYIERMAEAARGIPFHHFRQDVGRFVNPVDDPYGRVDQYTQGSFGAPYINSSKLTADGEQWDIDDGHWGEYCSVPYMMTARRAYLRTVEGMAAFGIMVRNQEAERGTVYPWDGGPLDSNDEAGRSSRLNYYKTDPRAGGIGLKNVQQRAYAWCLRQFLNAALLIPKSRQPFGGFWQTVAEAQYRTLNVLHAETPMGELEGTLPNFLRNGDPAGGYPTSEFYMVAPWQVEMGYGEHLRAARLGVPGAHDRVMKNTKFILGRFTHPERFNPADGTAGRMTMYEADGVTHFTTWEQAEQYKSGWGEDKHFINKALRSYGVNFSNIDGVEDDYPMRSYTTIHMTLQYLRDKGLPEAEALTAKGFFDSLDAATKQKIFLAVPNIISDARMSIRVVGEAWA